MNNAQNWRTALLLTAATLQLFGCSGNRMPVESAVVEQKTIQQRLDEDGLVKSSQEAVVRPQINGRIQKLLVQNGQQVRAGQLLAILENEEAEAAARQAEAQVAVQQAALAEAEASLMAIRSKSGAEIRAAAASAGGARANLDKLVEGSRPEEVERAQAVLRQTLAKLEDQQKDHSRKKNLFGEGALAKRDLEMSETLLRQSEAARDEAQAALRLLERGTRRQDRHVAQSELQRSLAQVDLARAGGQQIQVAEQQVESAVMRVRAAQADQERAAAVRKKGEVRSLSAGTVQLEPLHVGDSVTVNTVFARLIEPDKIYVELLIDQNDRPKLQPKQVVVITCDAFPGVEFEGNIDVIDAMAMLKRELRNSPTQDEDRVFRTKVLLVRDAKRQEKLRPGMAVFAEIPVGEPRKVTAVNRQALVQLDGKWSAFRIRSGTVERVEVKLGQSDSQYAEVLSGLQPSDQVVVNPDSTKLSTGAKVAAKENP